MLQRRRRMRIAVDDDVILVVAYLEHGRPLFIIINPYPPFSSVDPHDASLWMSHPKKNLITCLKTFHIISSLAFLSSFCCCQRHPQLEHLQDRRGWLVDLPVAVVVASKTILTSTQYKLPPIASHPS